MKPEEIQNAAMDQKRKAWEDLVELHDAYDKHEVVFSKRADYGNEAMAYCATCGVPLMMKHEWEDSGLKYTFKKLNAATIGRGNAEWRLGTITEKVAKGIPAEYRHFAHEKLFFMLGKEGTRQEEVDAIFSLRDQSVSHVALRAMALKDGAVLAWAYAKNFKDFAADLRAAASSNPQMAFNFMVAAKDKPSDADRVAISKDCTLALKYALEIDKGPHPVTRDGAARHHTTAFQYAAEVDKSPDTATTRGTLLKTIVMRTSNGLEEWTKRFRGTRVDDDATRKAACRTKYGAMRYAEKVLRGPHPDIEKVLATSSYHGPRYMYEIAGKPIPAMEDSFMSGYDFITYMGVFNLKPSPSFERRRYNHACWRIFTDYRMAWQLKENGSPMTKKEALKKSSWSLAYMMTNNCFGDKELTARVSKNYGYKWMARCIKDRKADVVKAQAKQKAAAV
jgi:hypothetical protein